MRRTLALLALAVPCAGQHEGPTSRPMNRLADETSPYLLQHKTNPVDWYPWGEEALARAKELDRPIFLSIGYSACHWCHVMEHESFEDETIAAKLNEYFVCIKVDREERPDLDEIYMAATVALTGSGGWPMSVFMTPDREPFFAGTYWPPDDRMGMVGFTRIIEHVHTMWTERPEEVADRTQKLTEYVQKRLAPVSEPEDPSAAFVDLLVTQSTERHDDVHGGFGQAPAFAPKFPHASELQVLLRAHAASGDAEPLEIATRTLTAMAHGGIYDQIGGGFHRYSTDRVWLVPHFEKMLYDNAQLARVYTEAFALTGEPLFERIARQTLDYLLREMRDPQGGIWSTTDADSEGEEGKFFVWSREELDAVCGDDAAVARLRWGVSDAGNWDGHNVLHVAAEVDEVAAQLELEPAEVEAALERARAALYAARAERVPPGTDDKVLAAWNGLALSAFAYAYQVLDDERYLDAAQGIATFVLDEMRVDGRLLRTWRHGDARLAGYLDDHAGVALGLLELFECDFDPRWLREATALLEVVDERFGDADGSFFYTADDHETLIARAKTVEESSMPSGIALAVLAFLRAGLLRGDDALWQRGIEGLRAQHVMLSQYPIACPSLVVAMQLALGDPREVVVAAPDPVAAEPMLRAARATFPPHHVVVALHDGNRDALADVTPIVEGKEPVDGAAAAYVCRRGMCEAPITEPASLVLR